MTDEDHYMISDIFNYEDLKKMDDFGIKRYKNALFKGQLQDGKRQGLGILIGDTGRIYEGQWQLDQRQGMGFEKYKNHNFY